MTSLQMGDAAWSAALCGRRVMVIEDEYFIADDISRELSSLGAEILGPVAEMKEAERILNAGTRIDGAVLDINIRSQSSFPLARALQSRKVPFVFTTGYDSNAIDAEFRGVPVWEKPLDLSSMARSLAGMILLKG